MKKTEKFKETFKDMRVEPAKEWRVTTARVVHSDKKKKDNKYQCRKKVNINL